MDRKVGRWAALFLFLVTGVAAFYFLNARRQQILGKPLVLAINEWPGFAPVVYAQLKGLYARKGITVDLRFSTGPSEFNEWLEKGMVDGAGEVLTDLIALNAKGVPVQGVVMSDFSVDGDVIVGRKEIKSARDLKGKTIGVEGINTFSHIFVLKTLEANGIKEQDVKFEMVPFQQMTQALDQKLVQAGHTWNPEKARALKAGYQVIARAGDIPGIVTDLISFRKKVIETRPLEVRRFVEAFFEAQEMMQANPAEATRLMAPFFKNDPAEFAATFRDVHLVSKEENRLWFNRINRERSIYSTGRQINEFLLSRGQVVRDDLYKISLAEGFLP